MAKSDPRIAPVPAPAGDDLGIVDALVQLSFAVQGTLGRIATAHDLSITQTRLLGILRDRQPTINQLAEFLQLDKSSVTGLVDRAQERGLVARTASLRDRRSVQVHITTSGRKLVNRVTAAVEVEMEALVGDLSPTQRTRLSSIASTIAIGEARSRGVDIGGRALGLPDVPGVPD